MTVLSQSGLGEEDEGRGMQSNANVCVLSRGSARTKSRDDQGSPVNFVTAVGRRILSEIQQRNVVLRVLRVLRVLGYGYLKIRPGARSQGRDVGC